MLSIANVCADDANDTVMTSEDNLEIDQAIDDNIGELKEDISTQTVDKLSESNGELLESDINVSGNTFQDISRAIDSADAEDNVYLKGITYLGSGVEIEINKPLTIIGEEGTVLDAQELSRIFHVTANNVALKNITFINGKTTDNGGAITGKVPMPIFQAVIL